MVRHFVFPVANLGFEFGFDGIGGSAQVRGFRPSVETVVTRCRHMSLHHVAAVLLIPDDLRFRQAFVETQDLPDLLLDVAPDLGVSGMVASGDSDIHA